MVLCTFSLNDINFSTNISVLCTLFQWFIAAALRNICRILQIKSTIQVQSTVILNLIVRIVTLTKTSGYFRLNFEFAI